MGSTFRAPVRGGQKEQERLTMSLTGTGAAVPTVTSGGGGITMTRAGVGLLDFVFNEGVTYVAPGEPGFWADTLTDVDGWSVRWGAYNTTTRTIRGTIHNEAFAAADLPAASGIHVGFDVYR